MTRTFKAHNAEVIWHFLSPNAALENRNPLWDGDVSLEDRETTKNSAINMNFITVSIEIPDKFAPNGVNDIPFHLNIQIH